MIPGEDDADIQVVHGVPGNLKATPLQIRGCFLECDDATDDQEEADGDDEVEDDVGVANKSISKNNRSC